MPELLVSNLQMTDDDERWFHDCLSATAIWKLAEGKAVASSLSIRDCKNFGGLPSSNNQSSKRATSTPLVAPSIVKPTTVESAFDKLRTVASMNRRGGPGANSCSCPTA